MLVKLYEHGIHSLSTTHNIDFLSTISKEQHMYHTYIYMYSINNDEKLFFRIWVVNRILVGFFFKYTDVSGFLQIRITY